MLFHPEETCRSPTRRLLIFKNANNLKTTRQSNGSGIPTTENPIKSVRVLASERRPGAYDRAVFANGQPFQSKRCNVLSKKHLQTWKSLFQNLNFPSQKSKGSGGLRTFPKRVRNS